jgi:DNA-binding IclR family transcriptional regulator
MGSQHKDGSRVKASQLTFAIVELIDELERISVSEVANELSIAKSTAHKHLHTLEENEYLVREDQQYQLSLKYLKFGQHALEKTEIAQISQPVIEQLAAETDEAIWVAIEEHGRVVYVNKALGERAVPSRGGIGERILLHSASIGKVMLAYFSEERIDEIIDQHGLPGLTEKTLTDHEELMAELEKIRERGVAFNDGESLKGLRAVASPIQYAGEILGAVAIVGTANRMKGEYFREELADLAQGATNEIELKLAYS